MLCTQSKCYQDWCRKTSDYKTSGEQRQSEVFMILVNIMQKEPVFSEKNIINEFVEENASSLYCSAEEKTNESRNEQDWFEPSDSDSNLDSDFEPSSE